MGPLSVAADTLLTVTPSATRRGCPGRRAASRACRSGDNQRVTGPASGQANRSRAGFGWCRSSLGDVDAVVADAQRVESVALCGEILLLR